MASSIGRNTMRRIAPTRHMSLARSVARIRHYTSRPNRGRHWRSPAELGYNFLLNGPKHYRSRPAPDSPAGGNLGGKSGGKCGD